MLSRARAHLPVLSSALLLISSACAERTEQDVLVSWEGKALIDAPEGFSFYPPLAPAPAAVGELDSGQLAHLDVELGTLDASGELNTVLATFGAATSPALMLQRDHGRYALRIPAAQYFTDRAAVHRFRVLFHGRTLATADVPLEIGAFLDRFPDLQMTIAFHLEPRAIDRDGDGVIDPEDSCPDDANPDRLDSDGDGIGDACECTFASCDPRGPCDSGASCDAATGDCVYVAAADGSPCADGDACNGAETCLAGQCTSGQALSCDDGNGCTEDSCDGVLGCVHAAVACEDVVASRSPSLWLRAADLALADGAAVAAWPAGPGTTTGAAQSSAALQPVFRARGLAGGPAVELDGTNDRLDLSSNPFTASSYGLTIFAVLATSDQNGHVLGTGSSSSGYLTSYGGGLTVVGGAPTAKANSASSGLHLTSTESMGAIPRLVTAVAATGSSAIFVDCEARGTSAAATNPFAYTRATIGSSDGSASNATVDPFAGSIAELIVIPGGLGYDDRVAIEDYLASKYGISCEPGAPPTPDETLATTATMFWRFEDTGTVPRIDVASGQNILPYPPDATGILSVPAVVGRGNFVSGPTGYHFWLSSSAVMNHGGGSFTWAGWMSLRSFYDSMTFAGKWNNNTSAQREYRIRYNADTARMELEVSATGYDRAGETALVFHPRPIELDTFYFIEAWHDATANTLNLRVGTQTERGSVSSVPWTAGVHFGSADLNLGAYNTCTDDHLHGIIDAVGYWRRTLTEAESLRLWNDGDGFEPGVLGPSQIPGCDGVLGSGAVLDACGVCGGGGASCADEAVISAGRVLWLRADDLVLQDGAPVASWEDGSGAYNNASQTVAALQPVFRADQLAGHATVDFDGADDRLDLVSNLFSSSSFPLTVFAVLRTADASAHVLGTGSSSAGFLASYGGALAISGGLPVVKANSNSSGLFLSSSTRADDGVARVVSAVASSGASELRVDCGAPVTSAAATNAYGYGRSSIGASDGSSSNASRDPFAGSIAELIVYQGALGASQRAAIEAYLAGKYGTTCP